MDGPTPRYYQGAPRAPQLGDVLWLHAHFGAWMPHVVVGFSAHGWPLGARVLVKLPAEPPPPDAMLEVRVDVEGCVAITGGHGSQPLTACPGFRSDPPGTWRYLEELPAGAERFCPGPSAEQARAAVASFAGTFGRGASPVRI